MTLRRHETKFQSNRRCPAEAKSGESRSQFSDFVRGNKVKDAIEFARPGFDTNDVILITGPTGSGKEGVARLIHDQSRPNAKFLGVSVMEFEPNLVKSELFGHKKGAFTGATSDMPGVFRSVGTGTLFLDEIGEASLDLQASLLRAIEEREIRPVRATTTESFRGRLICATNRDLTSEVATGRFRPDLFMRISRWIVTLPAVSDQPEVIMAAFRRHVDFVLEGKSVEWENDREIEAILLSHSWAGNFRELENVAVAAGRTAMFRDVPITPYLVSSILSKSPTPRGITETHRSNTRLRTMKEVEQEEISKHLAFAGGNVAKASRTLEVPDTTLRGWLEKLGVDPSAFKNPILTNTVTESRTNSRMP